MTKIVVCLMVLGSLALSVFANAKMISYDDMIKTVSAKSGSNKLPKEFPSVFVLEQIYGYNTFRKKIPNWAGSWFTLPYEESDTIAVQIEHLSDSYYYQKSPVIVLCILNNMQCVYSNKTQSLSFQIEADQINKTSDGRLNFVLYTIGENNKTAHGVVVGLFPCVSKHASLSSCHSHCYGECYNGFKSQKMDACLCVKGYTGPRCREKTEAPPTWKSDEYTGSAVGNVLLDCFLFIVVLWIVLCFYWCIKGCVETSKKKKQQANKPAAATPAATAPPPMPGYAYYPLGTVPPPPPPPQCTIEMSTLPDSKTVYCGPPPVAPATQIPFTQVPVVIQPLPPPKN